MHREVTSLPPATQHRLCDQLMHEPCLGSPCRGGKFGSKGSAISATRQAAEGQPQNLGQELGNLLPRIFIISSFCEGFIPPRAHEPRSAVARTAWVTVLTPGRAGWKLVKAWPCLKLTL